MILPPSVSQEWGSTRLCTYPQSVAFYCALQLSGGNSFHSYCFVCSELAAILQRAVCRIGNVWTCWEKMKLGFCVEVETCGSWCVPWVELTAVFIGLLCDCVRAVATCSCCEATTTDAIVQQTSALSLNRLVRGLQSSVLNSTVNWKVDETCVETRKRHFWLSSWKYGACKEFFCYCVRAYLLLLVSQQNVTSVP
jgi:hypothetical protein